MSLKLRELSVKYADMMPTPDYVCECMEGWADLIDKTLHGIRVVFPEASVAQIKEKFGALRIYLRNPDPFSPSEEDDWARYHAAEKICAAALERSKSICEACGQPGRVIEEKRWLYVRCDRCRP
jgi:hypothetical protein